MWVAKRNTSILPSHRGGVLSRVACRAAWRANRQKPVKPDRQKYFPIQKFGIAVCRFRPTHRMGRSYVVTSAGQDAVDAGSVGRDVKRGAGGGLSRTLRAFHGRSKANDAGCVCRNRVDLAVATVKLLRRRQASQPAHCCRLSAKRWRQKKFVSKVSAYKTSSRCAGEGRDVPASPIFPVRCVCIFCTGILGASRHPAFLCTPLFREGEERWQSSGMTGRENEKP